MSSWLIPVIALSCTVGAVTGGGLCALLVLRWWEHRQTKQLDDNPGPWPNEDVDLVSGRHCCDDSEPLVQPDECEDTDLIPARAVRPYVTQAGTAEVHAVPVWPNLGRW